VIKKYQTYDKKISEIIKKDKRNGKGTTRQQEEDKEIYEGSKKEP
jgi:hypothetical protein